MDFTQYLSITILLLLPFVAHSAEAPSAKTKLEQVSFFSLGSNGFIGNKSEGEQLYQRILKEEKVPKAVFLDIAESKNSTSAAKLYAACGLYDLDVKNVNLLVRNNEEMVSVLNGDVLRKVSFTDRLNAITRHGCKFNE